MRIVFTALLVGLMSTMSAKAVTVVSFVSVGSGSTVPASEEAAGVTGFDLGRSVGLDEYLGSSTYNSHDWFVGGSKLDALVAKDSLFWGFNSTIGYDLTSLNIGYDRSPTGPKSIAIDLIIRDVTSNLVTFQGQIFEDLDVDPSSKATAMIDLTGFKNVKNAFFRLTGWNAGGSGGTFDIENRTSLGGNGIVVSGQISPVPLPAGLPLLLCAFAGLGLLRRSRS